MTTCSIYIVATPWNFLNSFVFAAERQDEESYLLYVDFPHGEENVYLQALEQLDKSPFKQAWCFHGKYKGAWQKWRQRLIEIKEIQDIVAKLQPDQVFVGSDRRIEFQCAMTEAVKHKPNVKGVYLDEGLFSYTCRLRSQTWRDRVLDSWIKRLMYPVDWKHPITIGASDWISEGWLLKPEKSCDLLKKNINLKQLPVDLYLQPEMHELLGVLWKNDTEVFEQSFSILVLLPHPSQLSDEMKAQYQNIVQGESKVLAKLHPRSCESLDWLAKDCTLLPSHLPLELIMAGLSFEKVASTQTTALLTTKLLKPKTQIILIEPVPTSFKQIIENL